MKNRIRLLHVRTASEAADHLKAIGVEPYGIASMVPKMRHLNVLVEGLTPKVANIIKQEMLSQGGDAAVSRGCVDCSVRRTDVLIMGTVKQILRFAGKLRLQPFGLKEISADLRGLLERAERGRFLLETPRRTLRIAGRTLVMGVINMTPDSFSDGGEIADAEAGLRQAVRLIGEGADILDVGGESSRPGARPVPLQEELRRVIPLIRLITRETDVPVSIDTAKSEVARQAVDAGAEIVNDITALRGDPGMAGVAAQARVPVILMHMRGTPRTMQKGDLTYRSLLGEVLQFLSDRIERAAEAGISRDRVVVDPGIGFGKSVEDNLRLLRHLGEFRALGRPVCVGVSRKHFTGKITGVEKPQDRLEGTAAAVTAAILNGADIVRVHDVAVMKRVAAMADAVRGKR
ncbi:MAG: Dihydropteroate synthase [Syntrophaceae bacterium PtaB.Bin038]|nr:MAG: Dihydropteroate synthase [Syntrophaceae bacterium PtaB.Bin038]